MPVALVGSDAARAIHGHSAGADLALLGHTEATGADDLRRGLVDVGVTGETVTDPTAADLAALALRSSDRPLVLAAADLNVSVPGLLDLLDRPGDRTAALLADPTAPTTGLDHATPVRVGADGVLLESVGTDQHSVSRPNRISAGLLRIAGPDRTVAARHWMAADQASPVLDPYALALLALVRAGLPVHAQDLGPGGDPAASRRHVGWSRGAVTQPGPPGSPWQQRLAASSRGGDGFYSSFVVRPLSRKCTALGLRFNWSPNALTVVSLLVGLLSAGLVWLGPPWAWIAAALLLQVALVIDCMDGEIARFTRRYSAFGGWLDGIGDRIKEYAVFAALAAVATREGSEVGWLLAIIAMVVVTARHLEDAGFNDRLRPSRTSRPVLLPLDRRDDGGSPGERTTFAMPPERTARIVFWLKKIIHVPIAERYLVLSLGLFTFHPLWVLVAALACSAFALAWTQGGRLIMALSNRAPVPAGDGSGIGSLDDQLDLGPLARAAGRLFVLPFPLGLGAGVLAWIGGIAAVCLELPWVAVALAVVAAVAIGWGCRAPLRHRLGWQSLPIIWISEAAVVAALLSCGVPGGVVFVFLSVVAYRRYDLIYTGSMSEPGSERIVNRLGLGAEGRVVVALSVLAIVHTLNDDPAPALGRFLLVLAGWFLLLFLGQSVLRWVAWRRSAQSPSSA